MGELTFFDVIPKVVEYRAVKFTEYNAHALYSELKDASKYPTPAIDMIELNGKPEYIVVLHDKKECCIPVGWWFIFNENRMFAKPDLDFNRDYDLVVPERKKEETVEQNSNEVPVYAANPGIHNPRGGKVDIEMTPYNPTPEQLANMTVDQRAGVRRFEPVTETKGANDDYSI